MTCVPFGRVRFGGVGLPTSRPYAIQPNREIVTCLQRKCANFATIRPQGSRLRPEARSDADARARRRRRGARPLRAAAPARRARGRRRRRGARRGARRSTRVREGAYDAIFLDIEMPGLTGLDAAALVRAGSSPPAIVFVTAHAEYAVEAFAVEAFDYLLKPVDPERLARVVERLRERADRRRAAGAPDPRRRGRAHRADRRRAGALRAGRRRLLPRPHLRPLVPRHRLAGRARGVAAAAALHPHPPLAPREPRQGRGGEARRERPHAARARRRRRAPSSTSRAGSRAACASCSASEPRPAGQRWASSRASSSVEPTTTSARAPRSLGPSRRDDRDAHRELQAVERREAVEVGGVVARVERALQPVRREQAPHGGALRRLERRQHLQHHAGPSACGSPPPARRARRPRGSGARRRWSAAVR